MTLLVPTLLLYLLVGICVGVAFYVSNHEENPTERWFAVATAIPFWPIYLPLLLSGKGSSEPKCDPTPAPPPKDGMAATIRQVDAELEAALNSLDGWAEHVLAHERKASAFAKWIGCSPRLPSLIQPRWKPSPRSQYPLP
jgi:hypothetical protein